MSASIERARKLARELASLLNGGGVDVDAGPRPWTAPENPPPIAETPGIAFGISLGSKERMRAARAVLDAAHAFAETEAAWAKRDAPSEAWDAAQTTLRCAARAYAAAGLRAGSTEASSGAARFKVEVPPSREGGNRG